MNFLSRSRLKFPTLAALLSCAVVTAQASTIIIDSTTLNGSFENPDDSNQTTFDSWTTGGNVAAIQRNNNNAALVTDGSYSLVVGTQTTSGDKLGAMMNTGYVVSTGDSFLLSFDWANAFNWDAEDRIDWRLFTSDDNTLTGTLTTIGLGDTGTDSDTTVNTFDTESITTGTITAPSVGQQLWIEFYSSTTTLTGTSGEFARVDNVVLTAIPEPSAVLVGLVSCGLLLVRRRRR